jgi:hypothetical protein
MTTSPQTMANHSFSHTRTSVSLRLPLHFLHLIKDEGTVTPNELTPGIPSEEYERRRKDLMDSLPNNSVVVLIAAPVKYMSGSM